MPFAVVLILLVIGTVIFHVYSQFAENGWWFTDLASNWGLIDTTVDITVYITGLVFVALNLFMAYAIIRFRYREGARATYEPENKRLETILTVLTAFGVVAMLAPGLVVWANFVEVPDEAHAVEAVGQQWHWTYRLPGKDGKFGEVDAERISDDNPFGLDPDDPNGQDDRLVYSGEVHIPIDRPVKFLLRSKDVLHDFAVAQFRVKMDLVPGMQTYLWFTPTETGRFEVLCEELCGIAHHTMRGMVVVDELEDFNTWLERQPTFLETQSKSPGNAAIGAAQYAVCASCHGQQGEGLKALNAPKLAGQSAWYLKRQILSYKNGLRGTHEDDVYGRQMAPMAATLTDEAAIDNVIAHIRTLPDTPAPTTIDGDVARGEKLYRTCAYCHGAQGQGIQALNAPRAAGMNDWYIARQLQYFKEGIRGSHPSDYYGKQMGFMGRILEDEAAINDLVAYINTLKPDSDKMVGLVTQTQ